MYAQKRGGKEGTNYEDTWRETSPRRKARAKTLNQECVSFPTSTRILWPEKAKSEIQRQGNRGSRDQIQRALKVIVKNSGFC